MCANALITAFGRGTEWRRALEARARKFQIPEEGERFAEGCAEGSEVERTQFVWKLHDYPRFKVGDG